MIHGLTSNSRRHLNRQALATGASALLAMIALVACGAGTSRTLDSEQRPGTTQSASDAPTIARVGEATPILPLAGGTNDTIPVVTTSTTLPQAPLVTIPDVGFDVDASALTPTAVSILAASLGQLRDLAGIEIDGHTDSTGSPEHNQELSEARATAVGAWLITQGVAPERIIFRGFGATRPVAGNDDAAGRAANRRVEIFAG